MLLQEGLAAAEEGEEEGEEEEVAEEAAEAAAEEAAEEVVVKAAAEGGALASTAMMHSQYQIHSSTESPKMGKMGGAYMMSITTSIHGSLNVLYEMLRSAELTAYLVRAMGALRGEGGGGGGAWRARGVPGRRTESARAGSGRGATWVAAAATPTPGTASRAAP